jgi:hypothetical protein
MRFYLDIENAYNYSADQQPDLLLVLDSKGQPVIVNPTAQPSQQRYLLKTLKTYAGTVLPTIGIIIEI